MKKSFKIISASLVVLIVGSYIFMNQIVYPLKFEDSIKKYSTQYNVDPYLVAGIICNESRFVERTDYNAEDKNGLIQIREYVAVKWAKEMGLKNFDPKDVNKSDVSINMACWYLSKSSNNEVNSWITRNVKEDNSNKLSDTDIKDRASILKNNINMYKIAHPFLKK